MNTGTVSVRYAKALLQYAVEQGDAAQVYLEMQTLALRMRAVRAIHDRLVDPTLSVADKCSRHGRKETAERLCTGFLQARCRCRTR